MQCTSKNKFLFLLFILPALGSCKKLVSVNEPTSTITTTETFADSIDALSALTGVYSTIGSTNSTAFYFLNNAITFYAGTSSDELAPYSAYGDQLSIYANSILNNNNSVLNDVWTPAYKIIYQVNAIINGVQASSGISTTAKNEFIGEAKFLRALSYFYLTNLYGDVPYITITDYPVNSLASRTAQAQVYQNIITDLQAAQSLLPGDYSAGGGDRVRANKWAATALLARVYLYTKDYSDAATLSASVIGNSTLFSLNQDLNKVFLKNALGNNEAILQIQLNTSQLPYNATGEGYNIIPTDGSTPTYYLSNQLLNAFEPGDQRRVKWVDSVNNYGDMYYFPYKYKIGYPQMLANAAATEYPTLLRLAEQYLIHAEAMAQPGTNLGAAISDLNAIRERAGLADLSSSLTQDQVLTAITHERQVELFSEYGHRWLDLKRAGQVDSVMSAATPLKGEGTTWKSYQQLYPIPANEIQYDPNLTQNTGYIN